MGETFVEKNSDGIFVIQDNTIVYANKALSKMSGYSVTELRDGSVDLIFSPEYHGQIRDYQPSRIADESRANMDTVDLQTKRGEQVPVQIAVSATEYQGKAAIYATCRDISEDVEQQQETQTLRDRLELAIEGAGVGVWDWNMQTNEVEYNDQWAAMLGYSLEEIEPHLNAWEDRVHNEDLTLVENALEAHTKGETEYYDCEHRMQTADGDWKWIRDIGKIVDRDADDEPQRAVGLHIDIDEQKRQKKYLKKAQEVGDIGWWRKEIPSDQIYWSDRVYDMWDVDDENGFIDHEQFLEFIYPDDTSHVDQAWKEALQGDSYDIEHRIITPDGETKWMRQQAEVVFQDGEPISATGVVQDITTQKQRENELTRLRQQFEHFSANVRDAFFLVTADYSETLYVNSAVEHIYGIAPEEAYADPESWLRHIHPDDKDALLRAVEDFRNGVVKGTLSQQARIQHPTRGLRWIQAEINIITDEDGTVTQIAGITSDITERKQRERELEAFTQELKTQRDNLEILNQVVRHDIRNDLQLIQAYAELLAESGSLEETHQLYLSKIQKATRNAVDLTTTARDLADVMLQTDSEQMAVSLQNVLKQQVDRLRSGEENVIVSVSRAFPEVEVKADSLLDAIFRNLLKNAVQHNNKELPKITIDTTVDEETVNVQIADNGPGVSDMLKDEIFGRGNQGLETEGTGVGLYLVKTLVDRYGGDVWVEDNDPEGAVFIIELQRVQ